MDEALLDGDLLSLWHLWEPGYLFVWKTREGPSLFLSFPCDFFFLKSFSIVIRRRRNFELSWSSSRAQVWLPPSLKADEGWAQTLTLGCVSVHSMRCQSILHMAMFGYKKDTAMRYSRLLNDHFKVGHTKLPAGWLWWLLMSAEQSKTN